MIKNDIGKHGPRPLGFDFWTKETYGNKEFLLNAINYLLDDTGLINIRSKEVKIAFLDPYKIENESSKWQLITIIIPLILLFIFGFIYNFMRKRKYSA